MEVLVDQRTNEANVTYGVVASGPALNATEVETEDLALEVVVKWGEQSVLHVSHLARGHAFVVGDDTEEADGGGGRFLVPAEVLPVSSFELARIADDGKITWSVPPACSGEMLLDGQSLPLGAGTHTLRDGATARIFVGDFAFVVRGVRAGRKVAAASPVDRRPWTYFGATVFVAALILTFFHLAPPTSAALSVSDVSTGSRLVDFAIQANSTEPPPPSFLEDGGGGGSPGQAAEGPEGQAGDETAEHTTHRAGVRGPRTSEVTQLARNASEYIQSHGVIGALRALAFDGGPTSPFGAEQAIGSDAVSAVGALLGDQVGGNFGLGGLGMRSSGRGGPGSVLGTFGLGDFGTYTGGRRPGPGTGTGTGPGGPGLHGRDSRGPRITPQPVEVANPGLSADAIRRVVHRHLNEVRFCYEQGLQRRGDLEGRVVTSFLIGPTGAVGVATATSDSTLSDGGVKTCVAQAVRRWAFPAPNNGQVIRVTYPFTFTPS